MQLSRQSGLRRLAIILGLLVVLLVVGMIFQRIDTQKQVLLVEAAVANLTAVLSSQQQGSQQEQAEHRLAIQSLRDSLAQSNRHQQDTEESSHSLLSATSTQLRQSLKEHQLLLSQLRSSTAEQEELHQSSAKLNHGFEAQLNSLKESAAAQQLAAAAQASGAQLTAATALQGLKKPQPAGYFAAVHSAKELGVPLEQEWRPPVWQQLADRVQRGGGSVVHKGPLLDLVVRTYLGDEQQMVHRLREWVMPSMAIFWPREFGNLKLVFDEADAAHQELASGLKQMPPFPQFYFEKKPEAVVWPMGIVGYYWQMWSCFYADAYSEAPLIGFLDSDSVFNSLATADALLDELGRPIVIGSVAPSNEPWWDEKYPRATHTALGRPEVAKFMSYFPMVVWRVHLAEARQHITRQLNCSTFEQAFSTFAANGMSEFNVIFNYLFHFHRQNYSWHFQQSPHYWPESQLSKARPLPIPLSLNFPVPRVAQHLRYCSFAVPESGAEIRPAFSTLMVEGWCHSTRMADRALCGPWIGKVHEVQLWFDHTGPAWEPPHTVCEATTQCYNSSGRQVLEQHYKRIGGYDWPPFAPLLVQQIMLASARWPSPDPKYTAWQTSKSTGTKW